MELIKPTVWYYRLKILYMDEKENSSFAVENPGGNCLCQMIKMHTTYNKTITHPQTGLEKDTLHL